MGCLLNESNPSTMSKIAMDSTVSGLFQRNFKRVQEYLNKYKTMPNIVYSLGAGNAQFGDWILYYFLKEKIGEI